MKKLFKLVLLSVFLLILSRPASLGQQIRTPSPSPLCTLTQRVGLTDITLTYSRPGVKDRVIFGDLVPFGKLWRTGANSATKIEFTDDVSIEGNPLKAGTYSLFTIPDKEQWTVIFNTNINQAGTADYKQAEDALRIRIKPEKLLEKVESLRFDVNDIRDTTATICLAWENTMVTFDVGVNVDARVMADIKRAMDPSADAGKFFSAASYYYSRNRDLDQALTWVNKSIELAPDRYFVVYLKSNILAGLGRYKEAVTAAQSSKDLASKAGNEDYVALNNKNIAKWQSMK